MALTDTGLVARYYLDEAASGITDGATVQDASSNNYDLTINDGDGTTDLEYTETSGNRGLSFKDIAGNQRVYRAIDGTSDALRDLSGTETKWTIECVLDMTTGNNNGGRVFVINGRAGDSPDIGFNHTASSPWLRAYWEGTVVGEGYDLQGDGRVVVHWVYDTTQATANDRIKLYVNGAAVGVGLSHPASITLNDTLTIGASRDLIMGNREDGGSFARSFVGILYYAAIYNVAFDSTRVSDHYDVLTLDDDAPEGGGSTLPLPAWHDDSPVVLFQ